MFLVDTHTHLYSEEFGTEAHEMIQRAVDAGVETLIMPNIDVDSIAPMLALEKAWPSNLRSMMGLHPCYVKPENYRQQLDACREQFEQHHFVAVGEIGIDLYWDKSTLTIQQEAFTEQIGWAKELGLPIAIHARDAFDEIFEILDRHADERLSGVFHCFTGTAEQAQKALSYAGFYLGIGGVVTYKKAALDQSLTHVPLDRLVLETDAPYLAPVPHRGKRNESAYITAVAQRLSEIYGCSINHLAAITSNNAKQLFRL